MEDNIKIFENEEFGNIRTIMIDGNPWFVGKDIAVSLGYGNPNQALKTNVDETDKGIHSVDTIGRGIQNMVIINESGLYSLIFGSKLESAKKFKRWVTSEVLPQLRKTGSYTMPMTVDGQIQLLAQGYVEMSNKVNNLTERMDKIELDLPILPVEAEQITTAARRKGVSVLGGKQATAYKDRSLRQRLYMDLYGNLKHQFNVRSYKSIKRSQCGTAVKIIEEYIPPLFLAEQIESANAQIRMEI